jgi:hypothetical protein
MQFMFLYVKAFLFIYLGDCYHFVHIYATSSILGIVLGPSMKVYLYLILKTLIKLIMGIELKTRSVLIDITRFCYILHFEKTWRFECFEYAYKGCYILSLVG